MLVGVLIRGDCGALAEGRIAGAKLYPELGHFALQDTFEGLNPALQYICQPLPEVPCNLRDAGIEGVVIFIVDHQP